jgi:4-hydroxy-tetrahydrodipicolinate synthase
MANIDRLRGCGTAIVTPFKQDESIDESAFRRLVDFQIENGVDFIVACGTTGESVTMSEDEQARVVELTVEASEGRVPVVAGAGGYNTREVIEKVHRYERLGADAILSVTPYYNKPTQEGLYQHYRAIAESPGTTRLCCRSRRSAASAWSRWPRTCCREKSAIFATPASKGDSMRRAN